MATSDNLLISIQEKIKWADTMSELDKKHQKEVEDRVEDVKKSLSLKVSFPFKIDSPFAIIQYWTIKKYEKQLKVFSLVLLLCVFSF